MMEPSKYHDDIIKEIAKEFNIDRRIVSTISRSPFNFLANKMRDPVDNRPIRFKYLGVFAIRRGQEKEMLQKDDIENDN